MRANPIYRVDSRLATPPGLPTENDTVLVIATGTGAFTGKEGQLANYRFGAWRFVTPERGAIVWSDADAAGYQWNGTTYAAAGGVTDAELLAIAGLTSAADKGIQFTGSGTAGTFDLTAAAKTVLDDATVGAMVDTLGGAASSGSGGLVRRTSPTLQTPVLGTPASGTLTNCTGLPVAGLVSFPIVHTLEAFLTNATAAGSVIRLMMTSSDTLSTFEVPSGKTLKVLSAWGCVKSGATGGSYDADVTLRNVTDSSDQQIATKKFSGANTVAQMYAEGTIAAPLATLTAGKQFAVALRNRSGSAGAWDATHKHHAMLTYILE